MAVFKGSQAAVAYLIEHGADPLAAGPNNSNVLHICAERDFVRIAKLIMETDKEKYKSLLF